MGSGQYIHTSPHLYSGDHKGFDQKTKCMYMYFVYEVYMGPIKYKFTVLLKKQIMIGREC